MGNWNRERRRDFYYRRAKEEGYRSRAAYKLLQANEKFRFIRREDVVLDLGAAPGGWMQVLRRLVDEKGFVYGIDLTPVKKFEKLSMEACGGCNSCSVKDEHVCD